MSDFGCRISGDLCAQRKACFPPRVFGESVFGSRDLRSSTAHPKSDIRNPTSEIRHPSFFSRVARRRTKLKVFERQRHLILVQLFPHPWPIVTPFATSSV